MLLPVRSSMTSRVCARASSVRRSPASSMSMMISGTLLSVQCLACSTASAGAGGCLRLSRRTVGTRSMGLSLLRPALHAHPKNAVHAFTSERLELAVTPRFSQEIMSSPVMSAGLFLALSARCPTIYHQFSMVAAELPCARIAPTQSSSHGVHSRGGCLRSENSIVAPLVNKKPANDWPAHMSSGLSLALPRRGFHCLRHEVTHYKERYDTTGVIGGDTGAFTSLLHGFATLANRHERRFSPLHSGRFLIAP